jgi:hypothetical protein
MKALIARIPRRKRRIRVGTSSRLEVETDRQQRFDLIVLGDMSFHLVFGG